MKRFLSPLLLLWGKIVWKIKGQVKLNEEFQNLVSSTEAKMNFSSYEVISAAQMGQILYIFSLWDNDFNLLEW